ncbi:MAG: hypothetical protein HFF71_08830 [Oscillospiraceae bacterium]|jgi:hypothetical protein|nr:hypothetical protein [Oscillospiraceae bacterium]
MKGAELTFRALLALTVIKKRSNKGRRGAIKSFSFWFFFFFQEEKEQPPYHFL